jgi:hypothetical protein
MGGLGYYMRRLVIIWESWGIISDDCLLHGGTGVLYAAIYYYMGELGYYMRRLVILWEKRVLYATTVYYMGGLGYYMRQLVIIWEDWGIIYEDGLLWKHWHLQQKLKWREDESSASAESGGIWNLVWLSLTDARDQIWNFRKMPMPHNENHCHKSNSVTVIPKS